MPQSMGVTPQLRFSLRHARLLVVIPIIGVGQRKRLTILAVFPDIEQTTIPFASTSIAIAQVAWETALTNCKTTGVVTIYSCKLDETSSMQPDNKSSLFSDQLLASPNKGFGKILTLGKAFDYADRITNSTAYLKGKKQNPQIELNGKKIGCFSVDYPFAVK